MIPIKNTLSGSPLFLNGQSGKSVKFGNKTAKLSKQNRVSSGAGEENGWIFPCIYAKIILGEKNGIDKIHL